MQIALLIEERLDERRKAFWGEKKPNQNLFCFFYFLFAQGGWVPAQKWLREAIPSSACAGGGGTAGVTSGGARTAPRA